MKKKFLVAVLTAAMLLSFTGCGEKEESKETVDDTFVLSEANLDKYITLNEDYDVFNLEIENIEVTDDEINSTMEEIIKELEREIKAAIEKGYTTFISGMASYLLS